MAGLIEGAGVAGLLPHSTDTLPLTAPAFAGAADSATAATAQLWAQRSLAAGDALAGKFLPGVGLYAWNGATADRLQADASKNLKVALYDVAGNPLLIADDAAFTIATSRVMPMGALADETASDSVDEGDVGIPRMTLNRILRVAPTGDAGAALFPASAALGDALATPTTTQIGAALEGWNGATWDRLKSDPTGHLRVSLYGLSSAAGDQPVRFTSAAGDAHTGVGVLTSGKYLYNGATWDRQRNNTDTTLLVSASRTTTQTSADLVNYNGQFLKVVLAVTVIGTGSITLTIDEKASDGTYYNVLTGAAVVGNSTNVYRVGPALTAVANATVNDVLARTFRLTVTANNGNAVTYSCSYAITV